MSRAVDSHSGPVTLPSRRHSRGFTLLEALAALMLVVIVLPVAMRGLSLAVQAGSLSRNRDLAAAMAEGKLAELISEDNWQTAARSGAFDPAIWGDHAARFTWRLDVANWKDAAMRALAVEVLWQQRGEEQRVTLTTVVPAGEEG